MRDGETEARTRCVGSGHAPPGFVAPRPTGSWRGTPFLFSGAAGGPGPAPAPQPPPPPSLPPGAGGMRGGPGGLGRGGEGKEVGSWRRDPMSPKNVHRSQLF